MFDFIWNLNIVIGALISSKKVNKRTEKRNSRTEEQKGLKWRKVSIQEGKNRETKRQSDAVCFCTACSSTPQMKKNSGNLQVVQWADVATEVWRNLHAQNWWETVLCGCSHPWSRGWRGRVWGGVKVHEMGGSTGSTKCSPITKVRMGKNKDKESDVQSDNRGHVVNSQTDSTSIRTTKFDGTAGNGGVNKIKL